MRNKKNTAIIFAVSAAAIIFFAAGKVFSDSTGAPFSTKLATSIGAWYDETWQASGFYRLEQSGATAGSYRYRYTNTPTTTAAPVFISDAPEGGTPAVISQDMVVTEWSVSGHVHFSSGM
ncbi:MAG: hypothetical protein WC335_07805 [Candidatus Omnitrophota bacterium]|jgi:hypothetical protein